MSVDTERGKICFFEDFIGKDVVADNPEWAVDTDPAVEVLAATDGTGVGGVLRVTMDAGQANIGGIGFGQTQWNALDNYLYFEARVKLSALGTGAERVFVGLTDLQEDTLSEFPFTGATLTTTAAANPDDAIGFFWEGDMTGACWFPAAMNTSTLTVHGSLNMTTEQKANATITAAQWHTLSFRIDSAGKAAEFYVDGKQVYRYFSSTAAVGDVALSPVFVVTEGTDAINADLDYVYVEQGRDN